MDHLYPCDIRLSILLFIVLPTFEEFYWFEPFNFGCNLRGLNAPDSLKMLLSVVMGILHALAIVCSLENRNKADPQWINMQTAHHNQFCALHNLQGSRQFLAN